MKEKVHLRLTSPVQPCGRFFTKAGVRGYRFGFNGKEKVDEVYGDNNAYDFGARIYDPRLGRFLSMDPLHNKIPSQSPYNFAGNSPIAFIDYQGENPIVPVLAAFLTGAIVSASMQYSINLAIYQDPQEAFAQIDWYDVVVTGLLAAASQGASLELSVANQLEKTAVKQAVKAGMVETAVDVNYSSDEGWSWKFAGINKEGHKVAADVFFGFGRAEVDKLLGKIVKDIDGVGPEMRRLNNTSPEVRERYAKINGVLQNETFQEGIEKIGDGVEGIAKGLFEGKLGEKLKQSVGDHELEVRKNTTKMPLMKFNKTDKVKVENMTIIE